jgi:hypothetical protein
MKPLLHIIVLIGLLTGCGKDPYTANPKDYDNALTEEAFRFLFDRFPSRPEEIAYCVVWGYKFEPVPPRFVARFGDIKRRVVSYSDVKSDLAGTNITFRLYKDAHGGAVPVAVFQVVHLPPEGGKKRMEIAWAYRDQLKRELIAADEGRPGLAKFSVIRDMAPGTDQKTEPSGR